MEYFVERLQKELEIDEGCKYETYLDHLGLPTFGIGHLVKGTDPEYNKPIGTAVSKERVLECFEQDIRTTITDCKKIFDDWEAMRDGEWIEAGNQMQDSRWYKQVTNRADRLIHRMKGVPLHG
jgi:hypothetical protein